MRLEAEYDGEQRQETIPMHLTVDGLSGGRPGSPMQLDTEPGALFAGPPFPGLAVQTGSVDSSELVLWLLCDVFAHLLLPKRPRAASIDSWETEYAAERPASIVSVETLGDEIPLPSPPPSPLMKVDIAPAEKKSAVRALLDTFPELVGSQAPFMTQFKPTNSPSFSDTQRSSRISYSIPLKPPRNRIPAAVDPFAALLSNGLCSQHRRNGTCGAARSLGCKGLRCAIE